MIRRGLTTVLLSLLLAATVFAHARYVRSVPGEDAVVATAPERVEIWFSEELFRHQGENWIRVFGAQGADVTSREAQIDDDDRSHMWVDLQGGLAAGAYRVTYRNLSAVDADSFEGEFNFTLDPQVEVTSTPMPAATAATEFQATPSEAIGNPATAADSESGGSNCLLGLLPLVGAVALAGMTASKRKR